LRNTFSLGALLFSKIIVIFIKIDYSLGIRFANSELVAAKEKLEIVIGAASPQILNFFVGGIPRRLRRRKPFELSQEYRENMKLTEKISKVFIETLPIFFGILLSYLFWENNMLLFIIYLALTLGLIYFHKDKIEFIIFAYGILVGAIVEIIGTQVSGYQSFTKPDFGGIPIWLPVVWGYGFVAMKRISFVLKNL